MKHRENYPSWYDAIKAVLPKDANSGFCLSCGTYIENGVKRDARNYRCHVCDDMEVYSAGEILSMGAYKDP